MAAKPRSKSESGPEKAPSVKAAKRANILVGGQGEQGDSSADVDPALATGGTAISPELHETYRLDDSNSRLVLSARQAKHLVQLLDTPPKMTPVMRAAAKRYRELVVQDE